MRIIRQLMLVMMMCGFLGTSFVHAQEEDQAKIKLLREDAEAKLYKDIGMSDEQKKQMEAIKVAKTAEVKANYSQMMEINKQLNEELMKPKMDADKINDLNAQLKAAQEKMLDMRISVINDIRKNLTPDQFKQFVASAQGANKKYLEEHSKDINSDK